ncbi:MAG: endonuclease/exonuclease/phosphatase family protein [Candidatus Algichlamydia australiensis]|nr:endonuclease/exonuclease/phosphatase family protein [Chlamydiales bacterium]
MKGYFLKEVIPDNVKEKFSLLFFKIASCLTDPICKAHESFRLFTLEKGLLFKKSILALALISNTTLAFFTTLPGVALRSYAKTLLPTPYIHISNLPAEKNLPQSGKFSLLTWNICGIAGGYSISDGGVAPWRERIDAITDKILVQDADVNCILETFDSTCAFHLAEKLKRHGYAHIYYNIGPKAIGVSSGILVASKYRISNPEFTLFPEQTLVGRTKGANKGFFAFDLTSNGQTFTRIYTTHLQHSEEPEHPTPEEVQARAAQMDHILMKMAQDKGRNSILTGDLNLDDEEYGRSSWKNHFEQPLPLPKKTWGGDRYFAKFMGKKISNPLNLDYILVAKGEAKTLSTILVDTEFQPDSYSKHALSDHHGILSEIRVP